MATKIRDADVIWIFDLFHSLGRQTFRSPRRSGLSLGFHTTDALWTFHCEGDVLIQACRVIHAALFQNRPHGSRSFIGDGDGCDFVRLSVNERAKPSILTSVFLGRRDNCEGADNQKRAQFSISPFGDPAVGLLSAGGK